MNYSYKINPTVEQQELMLGWMETCRRLYNRCLRDLKDWRSARKCSLYSCSLNREYIMSPDIPFPSYLEQKRQLTQWKKDNPYYYQTSHFLCDQADMIFVEDIDFRVSAKGFLGKQMLDGGFGQFRDLLSWVCWKRGKYFATVDYKYTSQICPECNAHTGKKELATRQHICPECNYQTSRDHASARVILQRGLNSVVPTDCRERKLSAESVLPGVFISR